MAVLDRRQIRNVKGRPPRPRPVAVLLPGASEGARPDFPLVFVAFHRLVLRGPWRCCRRFERVAFALSVKFLVLQPSEQVDALEGSLGQLGQIRRHAVAAEADIAGRSAKAPASPWWRRLLRCMHLAARSERGFGARQASPDVGWTPCSSARSCVDCPLPVAAWEGNRTSKDPRGRTNPERNAGA